MNASLSQTDKAFRPFTRVVTTPPGWPWDQTRAALLEARHTSPVSNHGVNIVVRRLKPWSVGEGGEFVAIYLKIGDPLPTQGIDVDVGGRSIHIDLPSRAARAEQLKDQATMIGSVVVMVLVLLGLITIAFERRTALEDRLSDAELQAEHRGREAHALAGAKQDAEALSELGVSDGLDHAVADLTYVTTARDPAARVDAFYWSKGFWAVEAHGNDAPVKDTGLSLQRSPKPVRPGVWLWAAADATVSTSAGRGGEGQ